MSGGIWLKKDDVNVVLCVFRLCDHAAS